MASSIGVYKYGTAQTYDSHNGGWQMTLYRNAPVFSLVPAGSIVSVEAVSPAEPLGNWMINSIVEIQPTGLNVKSQKFACDALASTLLTAMNAALG